MHKTIGAEVSGYAVVSLLALALDVLVLYLLAGVLSLDKPLSAAVAYLAGLVLHYHLATSRVFAYRRFARQQGREFAGYVLTGFIGVVASYLIVLAGTQLQAGLPVSKAVAVITSFGLTYLARRWLLFSRRANAGAAEPE
jgi:putative flippase GtrA